MELAEIVMNPVRQRIFQYLLLHETGTVKEIRKALPDVPGASLAREAALGIAPRAANHLVIVPKVLE